MAKILGLDLGTNSIGWAVRDDDKKTTDAGVIIFQRGVAIKKDGSNEEPLNAAKRKARQQRRQVFYKDYRLTKMTEVLARFNMFPFLKKLESDDEQKKIIHEVKEKFGLTEQQLKNYKLNKYKDAYQLNARIAKLILLKGVVKIVPAKINLDENPNSLEEFMQHLMAFISLDPYRLRSIALTENISRMEFGRILYQIGKRRGFKSSRKVNKKEEEEEEQKLQTKVFKKNDKKKNWEEEYKKIQNDYAGEYRVIEDDNEKIIIEFPKKLSAFKQAIDDTRKEIKNGNYITLGNYLYHQNSHQKRIRKETRCDRQMYIDEFKILWGKHAERLGLNVLSGEMRKQKKERKEVTLFEFLGDKHKGILFYQRPLKSQKHLVAKCKFTNKIIRLRDESTNEILTDKQTNKEIIRKTGNSCCLISHPLYEEFRALQQINNLKINRTGQWETLTPDDIKKLTALFIEGCNESGKISIKKVCETLSIKSSQLKGAAEADVDTWEEDNDEKKKEGSFSGCYTLFKLNSLFGETLNDFGKLPKHTQDKITAQCIRKVGGEKIKHNFDFRNNNSPEQRKKLIDETGKEIWNKLNNEEKNNLLLEKVQEEIWHCLSFYEDDELLFEKLKTDFGLAEAKKEELKSINLKPGYGSFSLKTIKKLLPFMKKGVKQTDAIFLANIDGVFSRRSWDKLSQEEKEKLFNEVSEIVLEKQKQKLETLLLNSVIKQLKSEAQKTNQKFVPLDENKLKNKIREKLTGFVKEVRNIYDASEINKQIESYFSKLKDKCKNPLKPTFLKEDITTYDAIKKHLREKYRVDESRLDRLWHPAKVEIIVPSPEELPEPKFETLRNPIVKQALYALRTTIRKIEEKHGKPQKVRIELTRELNDKNRRIAIRKWQKKQEEEREKIKKELEKLKLDSNNERNILKYKLWEELKKNGVPQKCPYTNKTISLDELFGENNKFDIEHIIPRSRCWSNAEINLTLSLVEFNTTKAEYTPFELKDNGINVYDYQNNWRQDEVKDSKGNLKKYWVYKPMEGFREHAKGLTAKIEKLEEEIKTMNLGDARDKKMQDKYVLKYERDYYQGKYKRFIISNLSKELNDDEEYLKSLIPDTSYITSLAARYLKSYYGKENVETVKGAITNMLREEWKFPEKDRSQHYHHAVDAILIAFTDLATYQQLAQHRKKEKETGKFIYHPWNIKIEDFRQQVNDIVRNIAIYDKQRDKKITKYKKTIHLKGKKRKIEIKSVRGEMHEPNPSGKIKFNGETYITHRYELDKLTPKDYETKIPQSLYKSWKELEILTEEKTLTKVKLRNVEEKISLSKLKFSDVAKIESDEFRELISQRLREKGLENNNTDEQIPADTFKNLKYQSKAKGGEIKDCKIKTTTKTGKEKEEGRKLTKEKWNLKFEEISQIKDAAVKESIVNRLLAIVPDVPENTDEEIDESSLKYTELFNEFKEKLRDENSAKELTQKFIRAVWKEDFAALKDFQEQKPPDIFFETPLYRGVQNKGIEIKKVTFKQRDENGNRVRKKVQDILFSDIPNISEPAQSIIRQRLEKIKVAVKDTSEKLPSQFYETKIYVPVKKVRLHQKEGKTELLEIRKKTFVRYGNIHHAILHQDAETEKYYLEIVPFYFVINPRKVDDNSKIFQGIGKTDNFNIERLKEVVSFRQGDYFILGKERIEEVNDIIEKKEFYKLKDHLYKVTMISATSFDVQFRKHYSAKSDEGNINIKSSDKWKKLNPIKVKVDELGNISFHKSQQLNN